MHERHVQLEEMERSEPKVRDQSLAGLQSEVKRIPFFVICACQLGRELGDL